MVDPLLHQSIAGMSPVRRFIAQFVGGSPLLDCSARRPGLYWCTILAPVQLIAGVEIFDMAEPVNLGNIAAVRSVTIELMRRFWSVALVGVAFMVSASTALAAPTCQNLSGETVRCGTAGAMPVGWTLPAQERQQNKSVVTPVQLMELISALGVLFALLAAMPD